MTLSISTLLVLYLMFIIFVSSNLLYMRFTLRCIIVLLVLLCLSCGRGEKETKETIQFGRKEAPSESVNSESIHLASETIDLKNKGIGPIESITLKEIDDALVKEGESIHKTMCAACHRTDKKFIGPPFKDILKRRTPEWVMNMTLNPIEMTQKDPLAKALFKEYGGSLMANQNLSEVQARAVLEYMRSL